MRMDVCGSEPDSSAELDMCSSSWKDNQDLHSISCDNPCSSHFRHCLNPAECSTHQLIRNSENMPYELRQSSESHSCPLNQNSEHFPCQLSQNSQSHPSKVSQNLENNPCQLNQNSQSHLSKVSQNLENNPCQLSQNSQSHPCQVSQNLENNPCQLNQNLQSHPCQVSQNLENNPCQVNQNLENNPCQLSQNSQSHPSKVSQNLENNPCQLNQNSQSHPSKVSQNLENNPCQLSQNSQSHPCQVSQNLENNPCQLNQNLQSHPCQVSQNLENNPCQVSQNLENNPCQLSQNLENNPCQLSQNLEDTLFVTGGSHGCACQHDHCCDCKSCFADIAPSRCEDQVGKEVIDRWEREQSEYRDKLITEDSEEIVSLLSANSDCECSREFYIGGADISFIKGNNVDACSCLTVVQLSDLEVVYQRIEMIQLTQPYVPGYLAFREVQPLVDQYKQLRVSAPQYTPDVIMVDGNGILHPRGFGLACHLGVVLGVPTLGVAKTLITAQGVQDDHDHKQKKQKLKHAGDFFDLLSDSGSILGRCVRTCDKAPNPVYISVGHRITLQSATQICLQCSRYRIPEPVRKADIDSREFLRQKKTEAYEFIKE